jgi:hypothetical protein
MTMKISRLLITCMCWLLSGAAVWGQAANGQGKPGILGHFDPKTRVFRPLPQAADGAVEPPALTTFTGTISITFTITVKSTGISNPVCVVFVDVGDAALTGSPRSFRELGIAAATGSGSTRTCKVSIPYSWALATQSSDMMQTGYEITNNLFVALSLPARTSFLTPLDTRKVPANGTITTLTANVTQ